VLTLSIKTLLKKHGLMKVYIFFMMSLVVILFGIIVLQLSLPISVDTDYVNTASQNTISSRNVISQENLFGIEDRTPHFFRTGLFKSSVALQGKPIADKTIERIKSQLQLQCIMTVNGQLAAYINIKGVGLKKCIVGDTVNDMFTVLSIDKVKKCADISIIGHKITLYM